LACKSGANLISETANKALLTSSDANEAVFTDAKASSVNASLRLEFRYDEGRRTTILARSSQDPPLRVVRAFSLPDGNALVHLHNVSGGLLGDDSLSLTVEAGARSSVQLTTTGATRIYRPRRESQAASQTTEISVGNGALLEYLPDAIIPFAGTRFEQRTRILLSPGAGFLGWEILAPGREARGELFEYESLSMKTDVFAGGRPIATERIQLRPGKFPLTSPARMSFYRYWAAFYICQVGLEPSVWTALEQQLRVGAQQFLTAGDSLWGVSSLVAHGLVVRCLALHGRSVLPGLYAMWRAAKLRLYGREAVPPRKVS